MHRLDLFSGASAEAIGDILQNSPLIRVAAGEVLIEGGEVGSHMYVLISGRLSVRLEAADGVPIAFVEPGNTVGELSVIDRQPASAWVIAERDCQVLVVDEATFWRLSSSSHAFCVKMMLRLAERLRSNNSVVIEQMVLSRRFEHAAHFDALTGTRSRRWLEETLPRIVDRHVRDGQPLSLALLDIDHFKKVNDVHGHQAGDSVLAAVGAVLQRGLRPTDIVARFGGEEFLVLFPGTPLAGAMSSCERLRHQIGSNLVPLAGSTQPIQVTVSAGAAELQGAHGLHALLAGADRALYRAKDGGRNRCEAARDA